MRERVVNALFFVTQITFRNMYEDSAPETLNLRGVCEQALNKK
jgi:hypothetical protein